MINSAQSFQGACRGTDIFNISKPVGQGERQLGNRIGAGLGDMITGDRDTVEITDVVIDKVLLDIPHYPQRKFNRKNAGVLSLIFFQDVGLYGTPYVGKDVSSNILILLFGGFFSVFGLELVHLLVNGGIKKHRQHHGGRSVYGH